LKLSVSLIFLTPLFAYSQSEDDINWSIAPGLSYHYITFNVDHAPRGYNLRTISPPFAIQTENEDWPEEGEKIPEEKKKFDFAVEFCYFPSYLDLNKNAIKDYYLLADLRYDLYTFKGISLKIFAGCYNSLSNYKTIYYGDLVSENTVKILKPLFGVLLQVDLKIISPYFEFTGLYYTAGAKLNFRNIHKKPKRRYNLDLKK
jgi:hypothetical protein